MDHFKAFQVAALAIDSEPGPGGPGDLKIIM